MLKLNFHFYVGKIYVKHLFTKNSNTIKFEYLNNYFDPLGSLINTLRFLVLEFGWLQKNWASFLFLLGFQFSKVVFLVSMHFDILKKVVNWKNKSNNVVSHQYIYKWNKHTEILPPIIFYKTQNRTRNLTTLLYQLIMDTVYF